MVDVYERGGSKLPWRYLCTLPGSWDDLETAEAPSVRMQHLPDFNNECRASD